MNIPQDERVLIGRRTIERRIKELALQISQDYKRKEITLVGILKGSILFFAELAKEIEVIGLVKNSYWDFIRVSTYGNDHVTSGNVEIKLDLQQPIRGKHVLVIEDVVDTSLTLTVIIQQISAKMPKSLKICTLLKKIPSEENLKILKRVDQETLQRRKKLKVDYVGFENIRGFTVGYGLDDAGKRRGQPCITVKKRQKIKKP